MSDSLGIYISVPFCRAKCTYCNFASGVFGAERMDAYAERVCAEIRDVRGRVAGLGAPRGWDAGGLAGVQMPERVDSVYLGGGTPSLLSAEQVRRLFGALRDEFAVNEDAEVTLECAPGQLSDETLEAMLRSGVNRVSFGVQSFVDKEAAAVGRLHTRELCLDEIARMRAAGLSNLNVDLICGLPRQTKESWRESVEVASACGVPHVSVYMLEVDEDSRLGREVLAHGAKYGAGVTPSEDETAEWYAEGCGWLEAAGIRQYEISNFARQALDRKDERDFRSRHNIRYWRRQPYLGFGLDAHSFLRSGMGGVRWSNGDDLDRYMVQGSRFDVGARDETTENGRFLKVLAPDAEVGKPDWIGRKHAFEETMFLGLRMNEGVDLDALDMEFGAELVGGAVSAVTEIEDVGLILRDGTRLRLTAKGRMISNEVFSRLLLGEIAEAAR